MVVIFGKDHEEIERRLKIELFNLLSRDNSNVFKSFFQPRECQNSPEFDKLRYRISSNKKEDKDMFVFIKNYYQKLAPSFMKTKVYFSAWIDQFGG